MTAVHYFHVTTPQSVNTADEYTFIGYHLKVLELYLKNLYNDVRMNGKKSKNGGCT